MAAGGTAFADLTEADEPLEPYHHLLDSLSQEPISVRRFPIPDASVPSSKELVVQIVNHFDHVMAQGGFV